VGEVGVGAVRKRVNKGGIAVGAERLFFKKAWEKKGKRQKKLGEQSLGVATQWKKTKGANRGKGGGRGEEVGKTEHQKP